MGNVLGSKPSSLKEPHETWSFGFGGHNVPKHLRPSKQAKKTLKSSKSSQETKPEEPPEIDDSDRIDRLVRAISSSDNENQGDESAQNNYTVDPLFSPGPQGAFRWFKGRRFAISSKRGISSSLPSDAEELDRIRVLNYVLRWVFGGTTILAPVEDQFQKGCNVLNIGSGPGMWLGHPILDMALDYPNTKFTAVDVCDLMPDTDLANHLDQDPSSVSLDERCPIDFTPVHPILANVDPSISHIPSSNSLPTNTFNSLSTLSSHQETQSCPRFPARAPNGCPTVVSSSTGTQPTKKKILENLDFYIVKLPEDQLPFEDNTFDFVQQRMAASNYTLLEWQKIMIEMIRVTKPGGYVQLLESDYLLHSMGPKGEIWLNYLADNFREKRKGEPRMACYLKDLLLATGFVEIDSAMVSVPVGSWGLDIGLLWQQNIDAFIQASMPLMVNILQMAPAEFKRRWRETCDESNDSKTFTNIHCGWGRKPFEPSVPDWSLCELYR